MSRTDYIDEAVHWLREASDKQSEEGKENAIARAQAYATLAVAEEIRVGFLRASGAEI